jgi:hypothetical protein
MFERKRLERKGLLTDRTTAWSFLAGVRTSARLRGQGCFEWCSTPGFLWSRDLAAETGTPLVRFATYATSVQPRKCGR